MGKALIALSLIVVLAGCATTPAPTEDPRRIWCDHNSPRRPTPDTVEQMSRADLDDLLTHNGKGERWCGWKP